MKAKAIERALKDLNSLVLDGHIMEAFEKYYHQDVVMQENHLPPTESKEANRLRELDFLSKVTDFRSAEVKGMVVSNNISYVIWHYDYTHIEWGVRNYAQIAIQQWRDGLIINEQFIYSN